MQELGDIFHAVFGMMLTRYGMLLWFIGIVVYGMYMFVICKRHKRHVGIIVIGKLIAYPFIFTYGALLLTLAYMLNKTDIAYIGLLIILVIPLFDAVIILLHDKMKTRSCNNFNK